MSDEVKRAIMRAVRVAVAMGITAFLSQLAQEPKLLYLAPVLLGLSKYVRDTAGVDLRVI